MSLRNQGIINTGGNIIYLFSILLLTVITTRILGYEAVGVLTLAMTIGNVMFVIQSFSVRSFQSSDMIFKYSPAVYFKTRLTTCCIGLLLSLCVILLMGYEGRSAIAIFLFSLFKMSEALSDVMHGDDQRFDRLEIAGYSMALRGFMTALLFFAVTRLSGNLNLSLLAIAIGGLLITFGFDYPHYKAVTGYDKTSDSGNVLELLNDCKGLLIAGLLPMIITAIPRIALERHYERALLGVYGNISIPALAISTVVPVIITILLPEYGKKKAKEDYSGIIKVWLKTLVGTALIGALCEVGIWIIGKPIMKWLYTEHIVLYMPHVYTNIIAMTLYGFAICGGAVLVSLRNSKGLVAAVLSALLTCFVASVKLIETNGIGGAITVLILSYSVQTVVQIAFIIETVQSTHELT